MPASMILSRVLDCDMRRILDRSSSSVKMITDSLRQHYSVRDHGDRTVGDEVVDDLISVAQQSPSSIHTQRTSGDSHSCSSISTSNTA